MNIGMVKADYIWRVRKGELLLKIMKLMFNTNKKNVKKITHSHSSTGRATKEGSRGDKGSSPFVSVETKLI